MYILCNSCGKEFNDLVEGVRYSSSAKGVLFFCSDDCCKNYLNRPSKVASWSVELVDRYT
jgi:YHS domain-containing protein